MVKQKQIFRQRCIKTLNKVSKHNRLKHQYNVRNLLENYIKNSKIKNKKLLFYIPFGFEVNLLKLMIKIRKNNNIFVPFMVDKSFKMVKFRLPLQKGKFGILEPKNSLQVYNTVDYMFVPIVGFDNQLRRIGFGKGMYDRFFETLENKPKVIFIQMFPCYSSITVTESFDIQADIILS